MKVNEMSKAELEILPYTDLTYMLLKENKKPMNTKEIFQEICNLLGFDEEEYKAKIGDYYTSLTIDKRFVLLDSAEWDIRDHHSVELILDEEEEEESEEEEEEEVEEQPEEEEENIDAIIDDDELDDTDDDMEDLGIVEEEELDEELN